MTTAGSAPVTRYRAIPDVRSSYIDGASELSISAGLTLERSVPDVATDRQDPRLRAEWRHSTPRGSTNVFTAYEQAAYRNLEIVESVPLGVDGTRRLMAIGGAITQELSEADTMSLNVRHDNTRFSTPGTANYGLTSASAQYTHAVQELSSWYVTGDLQRYRSEPVFGMIASSSRSDGLAIGYRTSLLENTLQVDGSAGLLRFAGPSNSSSPQGSLKVTYLRAFTDLSFEITRRSSPLVATSSLAAVTTIRFSSKTTVSENTSVFVVIARSTTKSVLQSTADSVSLGVSRQLAPTLQASIRAERRARKDLLAGRAQASIFTASLTYSIPDF